MSSILVSVYMALFYLISEKTLELSLAVIFFLGVDITMSNSNFLNKTKKNKSLIHYKLLTLQCVLPHTYFGSKKKKKGL